TSIIQALMLMNGRLTADATSLERSILLSSILDSPFMETPQRIEELYLATMSRKPKANEIERATRFIDAALKSNTPQSQDEKDKRSGHARAAFFGALLNKGNFFLNN